MPLSMPSHGVAGADINSKFNMEDSFSGRYVFCYFGGPFPTHCICDIPPHTVIVLEFTAVGVELNGAAHLLQGIHTRNAAVYDHGGFGWKGTPLPGGDCGQLVSETADATSTAVLCDIPHLVPVLAGCVLALAI